jgi:hypothetical protein
MQVEVVGGRDTEIKRGWGFGSAKPKIECNALIIACQSKTNGGDCRGCMCDGVSVLIGATAPCIGEIARGVGFGSKIKNRTARAHFWSNMRRMKVRGP